MKKSKCLSPKSVSNLVWLCIDDRVRKRCSVNASKTQEKTRNEMQINKNQCNCDVCTT